MKRERNYLKVNERRRKRFFTPILYFLMELTFIWLLFSIIEEEFSLFQWSIWSIVVSVILFLYSLLKTFYIYKRQKNYPVAEKFGIFSKRK